MNENDRLPCSRIPEGAMRRGRLGRPNQREHHKERCVSFRAQMQKIGGSIVKCSRLAKRPDKMSELGGTMIDVSADEVVSRILRTGSYPDDAEWFFSSFRGEDGVFLNRENHLWDFKESWPFSYSDDYFYSIIRHIVGFANTSGGLLIFGVNDESRLAVESKIRPNLDKLKRSLIDLLKNPPDVDLRTYKVDLSRSIHVLFIRRNVPVCLPASFLPAHAERLGISRYWVRSGHETVFAQAKHIGLLFCGSDLEVGGEPAVDASLPPSPANVRQFVGRLETMERLFDWLYMSHEIRAFLHGKGGSGKTTIAFELAKHLSANGRNVRFDNQDALNRVIFLSAKEKALSVSSGRSEVFIGRDFTDELSLYRSIIVLSGESDKDPFGMERPELLFELSLIFDKVSMLIIVDDIDTLTTKGIDPGFDALFLCIARAKRTIKLLYTLRNAPTMAMANAIEVPGLQLGREYERFIEVCCAQFGVAEPEAALRDGKLARVTERRPLIVESILALRRNAGTYENAISLFEENVGDDARQYVFQREWNVLPSDNSARYMLAALALYGKPVVVEDLVAVTKNSLEVVVEAIAATREMFLEVQDVGDETTYTIGNLTASFVLRAAKTLDKHATIEARVNSFKKAFLPNFPELSRILTRNEPLLRKAFRYNNVEAAIVAMKDLDPSRYPPKVTEDPRFRSLRGYAGLLQSPPDLEQAASDLRFCFSMKFDPDVNYLALWHKVSEDLGVGNKYCDDIVDFVARSKGYSEEEKISFQSRKASRLYRQARDERSVNFANSISKLRVCGLLQAENYSKSVRKGYKDVLRYESYLRNTTLFLFMICIEQNQVDDIVDYIVDMSDQQGCILDPIAEGVSEYFVALFGFRAKTNAARVNGRFRHLRGRVEAKSKWDNSAARDRVLAAIDGVISATI